jgi:hypothetical protein
LNIDAGDLHWLRINDGHKKAQKAQTIRSEFIAAFCAFLWPKNCTGLGRMAYELIRISCHSEAANTRLVLEGKLAGACVDELDKCWHEAPDKWSSLLIDLSSVSFIDDRGKQLLKKMHDNGATLVSCSLMSKCLIAEICDEDRDNKQ